MLPSLASCVKTQENQWHHEPKSMTIGFLLIWMWSLSNRMVVDFQWQNIACSLDNLRDNFWDFELTFLSAIMFYAGDKIKCSKWCWPPCLPRWSDPAVRPRLGCTRSPWNTFSFEYNITFYDWYITAPKLVANFKVVPDLPETLSLLPILNSKLLFDICSGAVEWQAFKHDYGVILWPTKERTGR